MIPTWALFRAALPTLGAVALLVALAVAWAVMTT